MPVDPGEHGLASTIGALASNVRNVFGIVQFTCDPALRVFDHRGAPLPDRPRCHQQRHFHQQGPQTGTGVVDDQWLTLVVRDNSAAQTRRGVAPAAA